MQDIYISTETYDSVDPLRSHLEIIKLELLFNKYDQRKTYQYIKVVIAHVQRKFYHRKQIIWALVDLIDTLITKPSNKFNLYKIMHTLSMGIYDLGFIFSYCDVAAEAGQCVFSIIKAHRNFLINETCKNFKLIEFLNDLNRFYTFGKIKKSYKSELRLPYRVEAALNNPLLCGKKRNRDTFVDLTSDDEVDTDKDYIYLPSFICKISKGMDSTILHINADNHLIKTEDGSLDAVKISNVDTTPLLNTVQESKLVILSESSNSDADSTETKKETEEVLETKYSEFYDRKKHHELLNNPENSDSKILHDIKAVFAEGHIQQEKNEKLFATLKRLLKMKNSKTKKKFTVMEVTLDNQKYPIIERLGAGGFGVVYLGAVSNKTTQDVSYKAIKIQSSNSDWEFYINKIIILRLTRKIEIGSDENTEKCIQSLVKTDKNISFGDHSILIMDFVSSGTLLELSNYVKADKNGLNNEQSRNIMALFFTLELMKIISCLHKIGIIHGDLKADNCMVTTHDKDISSLRLIDFGKSIDMNLFSSKHKKFIHNLKQTDDQDCPEVREKRPFNYEIDYYGIAAVAHTLLFSDYIENRMEEVNGERKYFIRKNIPRGIRDIWSGFFECFMNSAISNEGLELPFVSNMDLYMDIFQQKLLENPKTDEILNKVSVTLMEEKHHNKLK